MDSMKNLNSSLPRPSPPNRRRQNNGDLLRAFKTAALSVTQLYKTAAAEEDAAREAHDAGYVDALDDILALLDERNLGLGDGEGWQVREWATQRHQRMYSARTIEGEAPTTPEEEEKIPRSTSPSVQQKSSSTPHYQSASVQTDPIAFEHDGNAPATNPHAQEQNSKDVFHFRSASTMPSHHDVDMTSAAQNSPPSLRLEVLPRHARSTTHRPNYHSRGADRIPSMSLGTLGHGAGSKRKVPLHEFFDVSGIGGTRDAPGGSKRGRIT